MNNQLHIPDFALGYLLSESYRIFDDILQSGETDEDFQHVGDVPLSLGEQCEYADYDLNFWYSENEDKWHCTAYKIWDDGIDKKQKKRDEWLRLW